MAEVYRDEWDDHIRLWACEDHDESERLTVADAREVAAKLIEHADAIDAELAASRALCEAQGHDWFGANYWAPSGRQIHVEECQRRHCETRRESDGWRNEVGP